MGHYSSFCCFLLLFAALAPQRRIDVSNVAAFLGLGHQVSHNLKLCGEHFLFANHQREFVADVVELDVAGLDDLL